jgi:hypothetical protein
MHQGPRAGNTGTLPSSLSFCCPYCFSPRPLDSFRVHVRISLEKPRPAESLGSSRRRTFKRKAKENGTPGRLITRPDARPGTPKAEGIGARLSRARKVSGMSGNVVVRLTIKAETSRYCCWMQRDARKVTEELHQCPGLLMLPCHHSVSPRHPPEVIEIPHPPLPCHSPDYHFTLTTHSSLQSSSTSSPFTTD